MPAADNPAREYPSPCPSMMPNAPPPSLVSDLSSAGSKGKQYARNLLLSLATPTAARPPPAGRLGSFSEILRKDSSSDWGIDESSSDILEGDRDKKTAVAIPFAHEMVASPGYGHPADCLFNYRSTPGDTAVPVLIDFANPDPFNPAGDRKADPQAGASVESLGTQLGSIRLGARMPSVSMSVSRSSSLAMTEISLDTRRSSSFGSLGDGLNPFAPPFALQAARQSTGYPVRAPASDAGSDASSTCPLPKNLPSSLPKRPACVLPPVFVKHESAALPQPMALPDVAPMGKDWEGEKSLSGNDKRRRASLAPDVAAAGARIGMVRLATSVGIRGAAGETSGRGDAWRVGASVGGGDGRPARPVDLGKRLRANSVRVGQ